MYKADGKTDQKETLVHQYADLVKKMAYQIKAKLPASVEADDLIQAGMMGLLDAAGKYQDNQGAQFKTYATQRIHGAIMDELRSADWLPRNIRKSTNYLWQAADTVWIAAGDTSTDYNRYTKRLLLIAVMKSTLSFWLNDTSVDYSATWAFLDRRINDVMRIGKGINVVKTVGISDIATFVKARFKG